MRLFVLFTNDEHKALEEGSSHPLTSSPSFPVSRTRSIVRDAWCWSSIEGKHVAPVPSYQSYNRRRSSSTFKRSSGVDRNSFGGRMPRATFGSANHVLALSALPW